MDWGPEAWAVSVGGELLCPLGNTVHRATGGGREGEKGGEGGGGGGRERRGGREGSEGGEREKRERRTE